MVAARRNERRLIFRAESDRKKFLELLEQACGPIQKYRIGSRFHR